MRKILPFVMLAAISGTMLTALGCSSATQPYGLTGSPSQQTAADREEHRQKMMYTDDKGHYRPDLRAAGTPLHGSAQ